MFLILILTSTVVLQKILFYRVLCFYTCVYILSQGLADNTVIAKVNKAVWDLDRPLEEDCTLELLKFEDEEAQAVSFYSDSQSIPAYYLSQQMAKVGWCLIVIFEVLIFVFHIGNRIKVFVL